MNIKKLFSVAAVVTFVGSTFLNGLALAATPDTELGKAYEWAHSKGITTMDTYEAANMDKPITRAQMAKMLSVYAMSELGMKPDTTKTECNEFNDIANITGDLHEYIITSCQLGLMGQQIFSGIKEFRPNANISRAEFGTALSRTLWGGKYEGGTPYYANHLQALQSAGIMKIIANAETTQEIRGYVMLMLMRSAEGSETKADCEDPMIKAACLIDDDSCPAECKASDEKEDTVVKSGDLAVKATAADGKKAILDNGVSDLDTITLKASEKITVNSITLERFGYSTAADVESIWLEDGNGNKIADEKSLSTSKDTVTLKIKKEYREMDASNALTIVLKTAKFLDDMNGCYEKDVEDATKCTKKAWSTIGFKVTDVDASAKNLDISDYTPYTYDLASYDGATVSVTVKGNNKTYNYEEGEYYEVSRLKVQAGSSILSLDGITLTNKWSYTEKYETAKEACAVRDWFKAELSENKKSCTYTAATLDLDEFVSKVKVTADGKEVSGLKYNVTKDNELVLNWDSIEVAIKKDVQIVVSIAMENLDEFGKVVRLTLKESGDLNAVEKKTGARINVNEIGEETYKAYIFNGSKIKFSNVDPKLSSTIDAAQGSEDVVIAKGKVTVAEEVKINEFECVVNTTYAKPIIEDMTLTIAWDHFDASKNGNKFTFKNVFIEKSGDVELSVDIVDEEFEWTPEAQVKCKEKASIGSSLFEGNSRYETSREDVKAGDVSGLITISNLKIQESKGSFTNKETTKKNVVVNGSKDVLVFDGTYTAKKGTVLLDNVEITRDDKWSSKGAEISFKVTIDGKDVADIDHLKAGKNDDADFDPIEVKAGESVNVKVVATAYAEDLSDTANDDTFGYKITLSGKDDKWNDAGTATKAMAKIEFVGADKITVSSSSSAKKQDVILASDNQIVAWFVVEPEKKSSEATIDDLTFDISSFKAILQAAATEDETTIDKLNPDNYFEFAIGSETADDMKFTVDGDNVSLVISDMWAKVSKATDAKLTFTETLKTNYAAEEDKEGKKYTTKLLSVNGNVYTETEQKVFSRLVVDSLVKVVSQTKEDGETEYTFEIEYSDEATNQSIDSILFTYDTDDAAGSNKALFENVTEWKNGYTAKNIKDTIRYVDEITWISGDGEEITVMYAWGADDPVYSDFFKVNGKRIQTFAN